MGGTLCGGGTTRASYGTESLESRVPDSVTLPRLSCRPQTAAADQGAEKSATLLKTQNQASRRRLKTRTQDNLLPQGLTLPLPADDDGQRLTKTTRTVTG